MIYLDFGTFIKKLSIVSPTMLDAANWWIDLLHFFILAIAISRIIAVDTLHDMVYLILKIYSTYFTVIIILAIIQIHLEL